MEYFHLSASDQRDIISTASASTGRAEYVIEKDIWLCLVLRELFSMPDAKPMAFKGGTSLSKVYQAINRFSEDVDVTIDYRSLGCDESIDNLLATTNRVRDSLTANLREAVQLYVTGSVQPYLETRFATLGLNAGCSISVDETGEQMAVGFPSLYADTSAYLRQHVLVEFGGRNIIDPSAVFDIQPDIVGLFPSVSFPKGSITVLKAERTFWEKVTLIHAACHKGIQADRNRISRHWYDLAMLSTCAPGVRAKQDLALLADVVRLKQLFYRQGRAEYDKCLSGELVLLPSGDSLANLQSDYAQMIAAGMMDGEIVPMTHILDKLGTLQDDINAATAHR
jgi:hypothetical protein